MIRSIVLAALLAAPSSFHYGNVRFTPVDSFAFQADVPVVALTSFKFDRAAVMAALNPIDSLYEQASKNEGAVLVIALTEPGRCRVTAFLEGGNTAGLGTFTAKTSTATASRIAGECFTTAPQKMFDDEYDFHLSYDAPLAQFVMPSTLAAGGGEPGAQYVALVDAIRAQDWDAAHRHVRDGELPASREEVAKSNYWENLAANYPQSATVIRGVMKGDRANIEIAGTHHDGHKIKGIVELKKVGKDWRVLDQQFFSTQ